MARWLAIPSRGVERKSMNAKDRREARRARKAEPEIEVSVVETEETPAEKPKAARKTATKRKK